MCWNYKTRVRLNNKISVVKRTSNPQFQNSKSALQFQQDLSFHSQCVGGAWRFREWSRSSQRIQSPCSRWIHRGGGPSSRGVGEAWEGRSAHGQSQVSGTPSKAFAKTQSVNSEFEKVAIFFPKKNLSQGRICCKHQVNRI